MNRKQIVIYIIALLLSFTFICIIALNQEPTIQQSAKCCDIDKIMTNVNNQSILSREWTKIEKELEESIGYMNVYEEYNIPTNNSFKSYMPYTSITSENFDESLMSAIMMKDKKEDEKSPLFSRLQRKTPSAPPLL